MVTRERERGLLVLIPAHNEARTIAGVVEGCVRQGALVWVLDDGSRDDTAALASSAGAQVLTFPVVQGKAAVVRAALERVSEEIMWVALMDGDGQHDPADLPRFWEQTTQADVVLGNRGPDFHHMPGMRRWTNRLMSWMLNRLTGGEEPDTQCGFRLLRMSWWRGWQPRGRHFELESEMYVQAMRRGARLVSVSIRAVYAGEQSKIRAWRDTWRFVLLVGRLIWATSDRPGCPGGWRTEPARPW